MRHTVIAMTVVLALVSMPAMGKPLPGRDILKFQQVPMDATPVDGGIYWGHDEESTVYHWDDPGQPGLPPHYEGWTMADDFADRSPDPVVHVKWWGSYMNLEAGLVPEVKRFLISFEKDVPHSPDEPDSFSHPGEPLLTQVVTKGPLSPQSGTFTETLVSNGGLPLNEALYEYNAELKCEFPQQPDTVYWLKIAAMVDLDVNAPPEEQIVWGWHNRDYTVNDPLASTPPLVNPGEHDQGPTPGGMAIWHFQDDAVSCWTEFEIDDSTGPCGIEPRQSEFSPEHYLDWVDGPGWMANGGAADWDGISQYSKDLAFELYTIPEPGTMALLAIGACLPLFRRKRR